MSGTVFAGRLSPKSSRTYAAYATSDPQLLFYPTRFFYPSSAGFLFFHFHFFLVKEVLQWKESERYEGLPSSNCWW